MNCPFCGEKLEKFDHSPMLPIPIPPLYYHRNDSTCSIAWRQGEYISIPMPIILQEHEWYALAKEYRIEIAKWC